MAKQDQAAKKYRASSLPMLFACGGALSLDKPGVLVEQINEAAVMGTCIHDVLRGMVLAGGDRPDPAPFAATHGITNMDELGVLTWYGTKAWEELSAHFPNPMTEAALASDMSFSGENADGQKYEAVLTGHLDVYEPGDEWAHVLDWKSGRLDADHYHQMAGYASLADDDCNPTKGVKVVVVMLREKSCRIYTFTKAQIRAWELLFKDQVLAWDGTFVTGEHCRYCPRSTACEARTALVRQTIEDLSTGNLPVLDTATRNDLAPQVYDVMQRLSVVQKALDTFKEMLRQDILIHGPLEVGGGVSLQMVEEHRDKIDAETAWPVMTQWLEPSELAMTVKISKTALLKAVAANADRGKKGSAKAAFMAELEGIGAVSQTDYHKLRVVRE